MKAIRLLPMLLIGAIVVRGSASKAGPQPASVASVEATISKNRSIQGNLHGVVKVGSEATMAFAGDDPGAPRLGLTYKVEQQSASALTATIKASVDEREVANGAISFTKDRAASSTLEGGGYSWRVTVEYTTPDELKRRAGRK